MNNPAIGPIERPVARAITRDVADLSEALAVLDAAQGRPVVLVSPPRAGSWLGPGWWLALRDLARARSGRDFDDLLDCDDASGRALEALRLGLRGLILAAGAPGRATIAARCAELGASLYETRPKTD